MFKAFVLFPLLFLVSCVGVVNTENRSSDEPEYTCDATVLFKAADSYKHAVQVWETPEDINAWIAANFSYDTARAIQLSETQRTKKERLSIYDPSEFFEKKTGVCIDLARFGVETLRRIHPSSDPKYLMIEFDPIQVQRNTFRLHWLVSFRRDGKIYFFADSKRPGHIAGPYSDTQAFISEYQRYRGRRIITFRELESYKKQPRTQSQKQHRQMSLTLGEDLGISP